MKELLFNNWSLWRIIRFVLSIIFMVNGIIKADYFLLAGGVFLFIHAFLNVCSTCASGNCEVPKK